MGSEVSRCGPVAEEYPCLTDGAKDVAYYPRGGSDSPLGLKNAVTDDLHARCCNRAHSTLVEKSGKGFEAGAIGGHLRPVSR